MKCNLLAFVMLCLLSTAVQSQDIVVAKDGSGNYSTVQAAFNAVPNNSSTRTVIYIKNGTYKEVLTLESSKTNVTIIGESVDGVVLTYDNYASKINPSTGTTYGTSGSSSNYIKGAGFYAWNITFENSSGPVGQALAIYISGDKAVFKNCKFLGWQDTVFGGNCRQYFEGCYIEGSTDFIFGPSTAFFENCDIYSKGGTAITAGSTESYVTYGYVFNNCTVSGASGVSTYFGRTWRPYAAATFMNSNISSVIRSEGWSDWGTASNQATARYNEYNNSGTGANLSGRVSWSNVLSSSQASNYTALNVLKTTYSSSPTTDNWNPFTVINNTSAIGGGTTQNNNQDGYGVNNGGNSGSTVTVNNAADFKAYATSSSSYKIIVSGTIDLGGSVKIGSNTTIQGENTSSKIIGTLDCTNGNSNIIIQNLIITSPYGDGITIWTAYNVFVNHITFYDCADGSCDINHGSDYVTVSWCKFYYANQTDHRYAMILGGDPYDAPGDFLHVSLHHNWFAENCDQRMPSGSYSNAHVYNNYFSCAGNSYCTNARIGTNWLVENNYYDGVKSPCYYENGGRMKISGNIYNNCSGTISSSTSISVTPNYSYSLTATASVPSVVKAGAGNTVVASSAPTNATVNGTYAIVAKHSGKALDVYAWGTSNGTNICQWDYWGGATQQFNVETVDGEWHRITPVLSTDKALDVYGISTASGANINIWSYWGGAGQQFRFQNAGSGVYRIINRNSDKCLDVAAASTDNGANVQQWGCTANSDWQMFSLVNLKSAQIQEADEVITKEFGVYSSPVENGYFRIEAKLVENMPVELSVFNSMGQQVISEKLGIQTEGSFSHELDLTGQAKGLYIVVVKLGLKVVNKKIINK